MMSPTAIFWAVYAVGYLVWFGYSLHRFMNPRTHQREPLIHVGLALVWPLSVTVYVPYRLLAWRAEIRRIASETDPTTALLIRARGFIERGWTQCALARDENGCPIGPRHYTAVAWGAKGALIAAGVGRFTFPLHPAVRRLRRAIRGGNISLFSDHQKSVEPVLAAFDRAIAMGS
jgi:hypothetical protein